MEKYQHHISLIQSRLQSPDKQIVISSLRLTNFRSYSLKTIIFKNGVNILYGLNGSGKTTIIEAILFALLRLHPLYSLTYIPHSTDSLSPIYIFVSNTWLIQKGKDRCEVELKLKVGDKTIKITRSLLKTGFQETNINDESIFKGHYISDGIDDNKLKKLFIKREEFEDDSQIEGEMYSLLTEEVYSKYRELGILLEKDEIFTSFFTEFQFFWNWESQLGKFLEIREYYTNKFGLNYLNSLLNDLNEKRKKAIFEKSHNTYNLSHKLIPLNVYNSINKNEWFKIQTGDCYQFEKDFEFLSDEAYELGLDISKSKYENHDKYGVTCQKCGAFICWACIRRRSVTWCPECERIEGEKYATSLPIVETSQREYDFYKFYDIFESKHAVEMSIEKIFEFLVKKDLHFDISIDIDKRSGSISRKIDAFFENDFNNLLNQFGLNINKDARKRLEISIDILELFFKYIFNLLKPLISVSRGNDINETSFLNYKVDLKKIKKIKSISKEFRNLDIITYHAILLIHLSLLIKESIVENRISQIEDINNLLAESRKRIQKKTEEFEEFHLKIRSLKFLSYKNSDLYKNFLEDTYGFESRIFQLLYSIYTLTNNKLLSENFKEIIHSNEYFEDLTKFVKIIREFIIASEFDHQILEGYQIEELELDYKILLTELKNQIKLLKFIDVFHKKMYSIDNKIKNLDDEILFLKINLEILCNNVYLKYLSEEIKKKSPKIFNENKNFYGFIDDKGIPRLRYEESGETAPILILSNGEKSKLFLAILGILISLSNRNQFILIDEPNEFLDPENIEIMKEYFSSIFRNKQLIICTFIEKYKQFQPALTYEVMKLPNGNSEIKRIK